MTILYNIPTFDVYEVVGSLLNNNIEDIRLDRKGSRWIFPTFSNNDVNYPNITLNVESVNYVEDSAGNYLYEEMGSDGIYRVYRYKIATAPLLLTVLTGKEDGYTVNINSENAYLKNKPLNIYLLEKVKSVIRTKRKDLLKYFRDINVRSLEMPFDNNKRSYASILNIEVKFREIWVDEYEEGTIINSYTLGVGTY